MTCLADPGKARGGSTNSLVINSFIPSVSQPFPPKALRHRHAQTVGDSSSSYKIDYGILIKNFLNPERHQNPKNGSNVTVFLLKGWILPIDWSFSGGGSAINGATPSSLLIIPKVINMGSSSAVESTQNRTKIQ